MCKTMLLLNDSRHACLHQAYANVYATKSLKYTVRFGRISTKQRYIEQICHNIVGQKYNNLCLTRDQKIHENGS